MPQERPFSVESSWPTSSVKEHDHARMLKERFPSIVPTTDKDNF
jgi:hypothetical protein